MEVGGVPLNFIYSRHTDMKWIRKCSFRQTRLLIYSGGPHCAVRNAYKDVQLRCDVRQIIRLWVHMEWKQQTTQNAHTIYLVLWGQKLCYKKKKPLLTLPQVCKQCAVHQLLFHSYSDHLTFATKLINSNQQGPHACSYSIISKSSTQKAFKGQIWKLLTEEFRDNVE